MKNVKFNILWIVMSCIGFGCDQTIDYIEALNEAPVINFVVNDGSEAIFEDSIKTEGKGIDQYYKISMRVIDVNENIVRVFYRTIRGSGRIFQNGTEILSGNFEVVDDVLEFSYLPENNGLHEIVITAEDSFGKKQEVVILLTAFGNLRPVAQVRPINTGVRDRHEYNLDASDSFDRDREFGGHIVEYEFLVNNKIYRLLSDNMNYIFPRTGVYTIQLRVKDNNGEWSAVSEQTLEIQQ